VNRLTVNRRYKIERKIGDGGMAEVFLGRDDLLHRPVAIKSLRPQYAADASFRTRFEREAQAAASFNHPNIIDIYDVGEDRGTPYIVMEYVAGETLKEIIRDEGPFDPDDVAILLEQVASALDYAHERGFVHRDIKPQNILVDGDGLAKVVDFGIAKGLADTTLTDLGSGLGTVHYTSPEQASGLMATPSSDIYSLAVVAYEMLTGRLPFESDTPVGIAMKQINEIPRHPSEINPNVPLPAGDVVMRALSKDPTKRFASSGEFASALDNWRSFMQPGLSGPAQTTVRIPRESGGGRGPTGPQPTAVFGTPAEPARSGSGSGWIFGVLAAVAIGIALWFAFDLGDRIRGKDEDPPKTTIAGGIDPTRTTEPTVEATETARIVATDPTETTVPQNAVVPSLIGLSPDEATSLLDGQGLSMEIGDDVPSSEVEAGLIATQETDPEAEVDPGSTIVVHLSSGPDEVDIAGMNLTGADPDDAEAQLSEAGLNTIRSQEPSSDVDEGRVIRIEPSDKAAPGDTVTIVVSAGDTVQIPVDIYSNPVGDAEQVLQDLGLTVSETAPVSRDYLESLEPPLDLEANGIEDGDVVGIQGDGDVQFGGFVPPDTTVTLVYYDASLDGGPE
jgi:serine/threonine-protein kinase